MKNDNSVKIAALSDLGLTDLVREGSADAETELVKRYFRLVCRRARPYYISGWNYEDFIQEGMLGLIRAMRDFDRGKNDSFAAYADLCIRRQLYTVVKKALARDNPLAIGDSGAEKQPVPFDLEHDAASRDEADRLVAALRKKLSPFEADVLSVYLDGDTIPEIARVLGKNYKAVDNAIQRMRKKAYALDSGDIRQ